MGLAALCLTACGGLGAVANGADPTQSDDNRPQEIRDLPQYPHRDLCAASSTPGVMHCLAKVRTDASGNVTPDSSPSGLTPSDLRDAYKLPSSGGSGMTVAIVDAQDDPEAESDLAKYRSEFGMPACTTANGCFKKVNENGTQGSYPSPDQGWAGEIMLDLDMVSAACPSCHIILVEADSANMDDLGKAVNTAVKLGADAVSNSYGGSEESSDTSWDSAYFDHPGVAITASAGDDGYGVEYPAASKYVTAVGGTTLARSSSNSRGWVESAWGSASDANGGTGSGCSRYDSKPSYQKDGSCTKRMVADVSADADPNSGVAVYDSYGSGGWVVVGGTSAASPFIAGTLALTGHISDALGYSYSHTGDFFDVTTGKNGTCSSSTAYYCQARSGYDGPTGNGTPNGAALAGGSSGSGSGSTSSGSGSTSGSSTGSSGSTTGSSGSSTGGSGSSALQNGVALTVSGSRTSHTFYSFTVPAGADVKIAISGGTGNANLYVKLGGTASTSTYDCRSVSSTNADSCSFSSSAGGTYSILLYGNQAYSGVKLLGTYSSGSGSGSGTGSGTGSGSGSGSGAGGNVLGDGAAVTVSGSSGSHTYFTVDVPAGTSSLNVQLSGGSGNPNLYVKYGTSVAGNSYDCRSINSTSTDSCTIESPQAGTYAILVYGNTAYSGVSLEADY